MNKNASEKIGFGGGCHWCTEAVFQAVRGVNYVDQGYISSYAQNAGFSEAVIVYFDPAVIDLSALINIHLHTHSSTSVHGMRGKYRSAIYIFTQTQELQAVDILEVMQKEFSENIITEILPFREFKPSTDEFRNYYITDPGKPFCQTYITPKLKFLEEKYPDDLKN